MHPLLPRRLASGGSPHLSSAVPLALVYLAVLVYASLYPFSGWTWPAGQPLAVMLLPPWPRIHIPFDVWSNWAGYLPIGLLAYAAAVRSGWPLGRALVLATAGPSLLSWGMEFLQHFVPTRVPSLMDWVLNTLGAVGGACLGVLMQAAGLVERWHAARARWFAPDTGGVRALLMVWPLGFLFPSPIPFAQGPSWERVQDAMRDLLADHPWHAAFEWLWTDADTAATVAPAAEALGVVLGVAAPCLLAFAAMPPGRRRPAVVPVVLAAGFGACALSSLLNFGPGHALAWLTPRVPPALLAGAVLALAAVRLGPRACAALGLVAVSVGVALVAAAPSDPYYAESLQAWESGRFVRFHGLAQWLGWGWPLVAGGALFNRLQR